MEKRTRNSFSEIENLIPVGIPVILYWWKMRFKENGEWDIVDE